MKMTVPLKHLFDCPVAEIEAVMPAVDDPVWDRFTRRQREEPVHRRTRSIGFIWTDGWLNGKPLMIDYSYAPKPLEEAT